MTKLPQKITYWLPMASNATGGKTWATGIVTNARLADVAEEFFENEGKKVWARRAVYATTRIPAGSYIVEAEHSGVAAPVTGAQKVMKVSSNSTMTNLSRMLLQ